MAVENFICYKSWVDKLAEIKDETKRNDFAWRIMWYGTTGEMLLTDDDFANAWLRQICEQIDKRKDDYAAKVESGKTAGRLPSFDRERLKELIAQGTSGRDCAKMLSVDPSAIYHDDVWKNRKRFNCYRT